MRDFLRVEGVQALRIINRYDVENVDARVFELAKTRIFCEPQSDLCYEETFPHNEGDSILAYEYLPGQYDQRADSAEQCLSLLAASVDEELREAMNAAPLGFDRATPPESNSAMPKVRCARLIVIEGALSQNAREKIKKYLINPVDSREASLAKPDSLFFPAAEPADIRRIDGFIAWRADELEAFRRRMGLAMDGADALFMQAHFQRLGRDPTETEARVLDTYWSDHCRHTTFNTALSGITIEDGAFKAAFEKSLESYGALKKEFSPDKPVSLMDIALIGAKKLRRDGKLDDLEESEEINACSIHVDARFESGKTEPWLLMFKNETHNHPTEIEPFGGAATCIGGAIRDPLSGRAWVYQAMRVTGSGDPRPDSAGTEQALAGKLPQNKITREAASGFSSYGNQIGLATGQVEEYYHAGFRAKRMELGAVIAAAPLAQVQRGTPRAGDVVLLVGGGTGRDGIGGATGSSKEHNARSVETAAAEVQKGNAVEERKIQRLFRNPDVSRKIVRCNDFGAGGVAVAVGELAAGLDIDLDAVPKKYAGLDGTELAISESQERMALVVQSEDVGFIRAACERENLTARVIARVTREPRLVMRWRGHAIVDIDRAFLDTAGAKRSARAIIASPAAPPPVTEPLAGVQAALKTGGIKGAWLAALSSLECASRRSLAERFDGSIGASSVLFPWGGAEQAVPEAGMAALLPAQEGCVTASLMAHGYVPRIAAWSPWHGAQYAVIASLAKIAAMGGNPFLCRLSFQEYFAKTASPHAWGAPLAALLGALTAQLETGCPAIGGKDSMSGTFENLSVPPTLVSFAVTTEDARRVRGGAFTAPGKNVFLIDAPPAQDLAPGYAAFKQNMNALLALHKDISAAYPVGEGGTAECVSKMAFGNNIGFEFDSGFAAEEEIRGALFIPSHTGLFMPRHGALIIETSLDEAAIHDAPFAAHTARFLGRTTSEQTIVVRTQDGAETIPLDQAREAWEAPLAHVFPPVSGKAAVEIPAFATGIHASLQQERAAMTQNPRTQTAPTSAAKPLVLIPVFPGTNCEYDTARAFLLAGAKTDIFVFRNNSPSALASSLEEFTARINRAQILALAGGFSAGDEPDGSGKYIANVLRQSAVQDAVLALLNSRKGLILGICNGFQALIKTGLVPHGDILPPDETMPTLTFNTVGRHISRIVRTRIVSAVSPWAHDGTVLADVTHLIPVSHGEGRIVVRPSEAERLFKAGQVFSRYVDKDGNPAAAEPDNPNGSAYAIEGLTSPCGRVLGKMAHNERVIESRPDEPVLLKNIPQAPGAASKTQNIFAAGVRYFA